MKSKLGLLALAMLFMLSSGCDDMKKMIDPTGKGYAKPADTAKPKPAPGNTPAQKSSSPTPAASPVRASKSSTGKYETPIRQKEPGRFLTLAVLESQIDEITFQARGRSFRFRKGLFHDKAGITSLRDSSGQLWASAIGDINMDGNDDAVLLLRTDRAGAAPQWDLAYLPNRAGRLYNVQTLALPGDQSYREAAIQGASVMLVPAIDGRNVHIGYSGGEIALVGQ
jgi:hypothetical protein